MGNFHVVNMEAKESADFFMKKRHAFDLRNEKYCYYILTHVQVKGYQAT